MVVGGGGSDMKGFLNDRHSNFKKSFDTFILESIINVS